MILYTKSSGSIFIGMIITGYRWYVNLEIHAPSGVIGDIPSIKPTFGAAFESFKDPGQLFTVQFLIVILTFLFIDSLMLLELCSSS